MSRWVSDENASLVTDFYEVKMAAAYRAAGFNEVATFDLFVRNLPERRNFLVAAGLDDVLHFLEHFAVSEASVEYLEGLAMFDDEFLTYLRNLRFEGDVCAVPEGELVFAQEPILRVTAPLPQAQLVETFLLNAIGLQTMIASKAARVAIAADDRAFVDFSPRRDHGADSALKGARASYIGGSAGTSLVLAGRTYGIPLSGTMAHSFVMAHADEATAFIDFARQFPNDAILLIDTYDTEEGARTAARVAGDLEPEGIRIRGVRLDSGDLARLSHSVRAILDEAGLTDVKIVASGDLDEYRIAEMLGAGCPVDAFGVGTRLGTSADAPYLGVVYKLVAHRGTPVIKLSPEKVTLPGRKQVWRHDDHDVIGLEDEDLPGRPLLHPVMTDGRRLDPPEPLETAKARCDDALGWLPQRLRALHGRERPRDVRLSAGLRALRAELAAGRNG